MLFITGALASARLATLVTQDSFGPIRQIREAIEARWPSPDTAWIAEQVDLTEEGRALSPRGLELFLDPADGLYYAIEPKPLGTLATCVRCMSVWTGLVVMAAIFTVPTWILWPALLPFAFSQVAITLSR